MNSSTDALSRTVNGQAVIAITLPLSLKGRFRKGKIVYDVINGHFLYLQGGKLYDHRGVQDLTDRSIIVEWDKFGEYDANQKRRIIRDCIV